MDRMIFEVFSLFYFIILGLAHPSRYYISGQQKNILQALSSQILSFSPSISRVKDVIAMQNKVHCLLQKSINIKSSILQFVIPIQLKEISLGQVQALASKVVTLYHQFLYKFILLIEHPSFNHLCFFKLSEISLLPKVKLPHPLLKVVVATPIAEILATLGMPKIILLLWLLACEIVSILMKSHLLLNINQQRHFSVFSLKFQI